MRYYRVFYKLTIRGKGYKTDSQAEAYLLVMDTHRTDAIYDFRETIRKGIYITTAALMNESMTKKTIVVTCNH